MNIVEFPLDEGMAIRKFIIDQENEIRKVGFDLVHHVVSVFEQINPSFDSEEDEKKYLDLRLLVSDFIDQVKAVREKYPEIKDS